VKARRIFLGACLAAIAVFVLAYANSLDNGFHFDDRHTVEQNLFIRDLANTPRYFADATTFSSLPQNQVYRPLFTLSAALDYRMAGGLAPRQFHFTQLALLLLVAVALVALYARAMAAAGFPEARWIALAAATLFSVHTANTQIGNYISARSELLAALGVLGGFLVYLRSPALRRWHLYLLPVILGALGKNLAVTFAPLLLGWKLLIEQDMPIAQIFSRHAWPRARTALLSSLPAFAVCGALLILIENMAPAGQHYGGGNRLDYLATQCWIWVRYVALYLLPVGLSADTDLKLLKPTDPRVIGGIVLFAATLVAAWVASKRRELRPVAFGIAWFWIALAPTSSIFPLAEVTNDHRPFLPFMGLNLAAVTFVWWLGTRGDAALTHRRLIAAGGLALVVLGAHVAATIRRNDVWRNDETLWADVVRQSPRNGRGLMNYGIVLMRQGRLFEARDLFRRAEQFSPNYSFLEVNLGIVHGALNDHATAERHFRRAISLEPRQPAVHRHYAKWLLEQGRGPEAVTHYRRLIELSAGDADARHALMGIYAATGRGRELVALAQETRRLASTDSVAEAYAEGRVPLAPDGHGAGGWFLRGWALTRAERHVEAAQAYRQADLLDPAHADALNNLGWTLGRLGFYDAAVPFLERAVRLKPDHALARNNLAWVRAAAREQDGR
jgi:protein O-mannosyl-transferase